MGIVKVAAIFCLSLVMLACQSEQAETAKPQSEPSGVEASIDAPSFVGKTLGGTMVSSKDFAGKAYILNFFASWCPPCRAEVPDMVELQNEYEDKGFTFLGVTVDEDLSQARAFVSDAGINFPVVVADEQILNAYSPYVQGGLRSIPTSFVISADGSLLSVLVGAQTKMFFDEQIREALGSGGK